MQSASADAQQEEIAFNSLITTRGSHGPPRFFIFKIEIDKAFKNLYNVGNPTHPHSLLLMKILQFGCSPLTFVINLLVLSGTWNHFHPAPKPSHSPLAVEDTYQWLVIFRGDITKDQVRCYKNSRNEISFRTKIEAQNEFSTMYELVGAFTSVERKMGNDVYQRDAIVGMVIRISPGNTRELVNETSVGTFEFLSLRGTIDSDVREFYYQGDITWNNGHPPDSVLVEYIKRR